MSMFSSIAKQSLLEKLMDEINDLSPHLVYDEDSEFKEDFYVERGFDECRSLVMEILKSELRAAKYD